MIGKFLHLEGAYLVLGGVILLVTLFVTTRPFMSPSAPRKGLMGVGILLALLIGTHFYISNARMRAVKDAFESGKAILCESRMLRKVAQSIEIRKGTPAKWRLEGENFVSPEYTRPFHSVRCIVK